MKPETLRLLRLRWIMDQMKLETARRDKDLARQLNGAEFDISTVASGEFDNDGHFCPTSACVIGSALFDPLMNQHGLTFVRSRWMTTVSMTLNNEVLDYDDERLAEFLGLPQHAYNNLTNAGGFYENDEDDEIDVTPDMVIERIDHLLVAYHHCHVDPANPYPAEWSAAA